MNLIPWSAGQWTRPPVAVTEDGEALLVTAAEGSDWWRTTSYGFIHDNGHALLKDFPAESSMEVSFLLDYTEQFDQCGIFIWGDDAHWLKATVEYSDGFPQLGAVVTDGLSDWSTGRISEWIGKHVTIRVSRSGSAVTIRARLSDGAEGDDERLVRLAPLNPERHWRAGPLICAPSRAGLRVRMMSWREGQADKALHA